MAPKPITVLLEQAAEAEAVLGQSVLHLTVQVLAAMVAVLLSKVLRKAIALVAVVLKEPTVERVVLTRNPEAVAAGLLTKQMMAAKVAALFLVAQVAEEEEVQLVMPVVTVARGESIQLADKTIMEHRLAEPQVLELATPLDVATAEVEEVQTLLAQAEQAEQVGFLAAAAEAGANPKTVQAEAQVDWAELELSEFGRIR